MNKYISTDVLVLCPSKFYTDSFIRNTVSNIGLNVIDVIYTNDYFKVIDNYLKNNYGFSIFLYTNVLNTKVYRDKYSTGIYTLHDIYYNYNNLIYNYYDQIISDNNYKKGFKLKFITFNSTISYELINHLNNEFDLFFNNNNLNDVIELFPDSFLPRIYNIDTYPVVVEPLQPLEVSPIVLENNKVFKTNNYSVLEAKASINNRYNIKNNGYSFIIFNASNITTILNNIFYKRYIELFKGEQLVLLLIVNNNKEYQDLKNDKDKSIIFKLFEKQLSIVDYKSVSKYMSNFVKFLTKEYHNIDLKVALDNKVILDYIDKNIFYTQKYQINGFMHYKAIIKDDEEEKLIEYLE